MVFDRCGGRLWFLYGFGFSTLWRVVVIVRVGFLLLCRGFRIRVLNVSGTFDLL